jgi:Amt family ammonium transporter
MLASPERNWAPMFAMNGALSGLVSITAGAAVFEMWASLLVGIISGVVYLYSISFCIYTMRIDDPLEAVAVHGAGGLWGLLAVGMFAEPGRVAEVYGLVLGESQQPDAVGILYGGNGLLLASQLLEICCVAVWVLITALPFFYVFRLKDWLRVGPEEEQLGVDQGRHGSAAYPEATSTHSTPDLAGNDSVHHYGTWNKYADESVVERTPTGQIIIPGKK